MFDNTTLLGGRCGRTDAVLLRRALTTETAKATFRWLFAAWFYAQTLAGSALAVVPEHTVSNGAVHLDGVSPHNPIIYDNDWWFDVFDNNYLWGQVSLGQADLRGNIVTRDMWDWEKGYQYKMERCVEDARKALKLARESGLRNLPDITIGSDRVLMPPESGRIADTEAHPSDGSRLIVAEARKASRTKPLLVITGGPLTTVANALLTDPDIAPNLVVFSLTVSSYGYNGKDSWSPYIVAKLTRLVDWATGAFWDRNSVFSPKDFESLPKNPFCDDMRRLIASDLGQANQLGDGAALVWLWRNDCWKEVVLRRAEWRGKSVRFTEAKPSVNADVLEIPKAATDLSSSREEFFRVVGNPAVYGGTANPGSTRSEGKRLQPLRVSENKRFFITADGQPFFWMADTAWELFHRLDRSEAEQYLKDRAAKGFNVVQAVALAELNGLVEPNRYGHLPLVAKDPAQPDLKPGRGNDYWDFVEEVLELAAANGLYVGLLPTWGKYVTSSPFDGKVDGIFNPGNALEYGRFIGGRFAGYSNLIWILGGDKAPSTAEALAIWRAMARGISLGVVGREDYDAVMMTYHTAGPGHVSDFIHNEPWLDFTSAQSSHGDLVESWRFIEKHWDQQPIKPIVDLESSYPGALIRAAWLPETLRAGHLSTRPSNDDHARRAAYWAVFAGAAGHTYGHNSVWQMYAPPRKPILDAKLPWQEALDAPSAVQMGYLRRLMESRPWAGRTPDQNLIVGGARTREEHLRALRGDGYVMIYAPTGRPFMVKVGTMSARKVNAWWFDPRAGKPVAVGQLIPQEQRQFDPPGKPGVGNDWVLVLDDARSEFPAPGSVKPPP